MVAPPTAPVTFLFTDIVGSARLQQQLGDRYADVRSEYHTLLRTAVHRQGGRDAGPEGEACLFAFPRAKEALLAAIAAMRALHRFRWPAGSVPQIRMSLLTGETVSTGSDSTSISLDQAARISSAGHSGQILLFRSVRDLIADDLPKDTGLRDLGIRRLRDLARPQQLYQVIHPQLQSEFPPLRSLDVLPNNLPIQLTSFIGREKEIGQVESLLSRTRLLTLTGAGGAGKTRLALQVAAEALENFPDGVWVTDLAPLSDASLVPQAVGSALGVPEQPGRPFTATLVDALQHKSLLVVLDNCEHLQAASAQLVETLLRECQNIRILATSRVPLGVSGETLWRVPSLALPDARRLTSLSHVQQCEAVRLFVERTRAGQATFALTSDNASAVAQICQRLDGIPLAIELAAARTRGLAVEQIVTKLDDRFKLLTGGISSLPRHQTLRATMDWSYGLLGEQEQVLLRRLSVFAGGWTLEAAEAICAGGGVESAEILDLLMHLVDKSLVIAETQRMEARYRLLETVRQFGQERLEETGESATLRRQHRDWYRDLAELGDSRLRGPEESVWLARLEVEHDNLRAALEWSKGDDGANSELRLARALEWFWYLAGHWSEGRARLEEVLARSSDGPRALLPKVMVGAARLAYRQGDRGRAKALIDRGLALCRDLGDRGASVWFLIWLGIVAVAKGDYARAIPPLEESLALNRERGDKWWTVESLTYLGISWAMHGDHQRGWTFLLESLALSKDTGNPDNIKWSLRISALLALLEKDYMRAAAFYMETLSHCKDLSTPGVIKECLDGLAQVACGQGEYERSARLFGAAEALEETLGGVSVDWVDQGDHDRRVASTQAGLGDAAFARAWGEGRAMPLGQIVEYALTPTEEFQPQREWPQRKARSAAEMLTAREREVAALVALGLTNRGIAERLVVTERTAETHIQNILNKLGFTSRAQIAAWAVEHRLDTSAANKS
jgi:predicted ATPase/class 3 adenylate cyclase/DNA-binding CsgD family transcriptional regulator